MKTPPDLHVGAITNEIGRDDILDEKALMILVGGDRKLAGELADLYLDDLETRLTELVVAAEQGDPKRLMAAAHALRGSSASVKAESVHAAAGALEAMGRSGDMSRVQHTLDVLDAALASLRPRLVALAGRA